MTTSTSDTPRTGDRDARADPPLHGQASSTVEAVRGLDLEVGAGELVAFLGPNGAGKSTTLRMLTTLIPPTSGTAAVAGHDVVRDQRAVRRSIGYVGQGNGAGHQQRGRDELVSQGRAYGLSKADALAAGRPAGARARPRPRSPTAWSRPSPAASGAGSTSRSGMVHAPGVLFLDEPSTGLDPQNRANLQEQIRRLHEERGTTIVLTTHYLEEADALAQRVIVIDHGLVIADDTAARLKSSLGDLVTLGFGRPSTRSAAAERGRAPSPDAAVTRVGRRGRGCGCAHGPASSRPAWSQDLAEAGVPGQPDARSSGRPSTTCSCT